MNPSLQHGILTELGLRANDEGIVTYMNRTYSPGWNAGVIAAAKVAQGLHDRLGEVSTLLPDDAPLVVDLYLDIPFQRVPPIKSAGAADRPRRSEPIRLRKSIRMQHPPTPGMVISTGACVGQVTNVIYFAATGAYAAYCGDDLGGEIPDSTLDTISEIVSEYEADGWSTLT